MRIRGVSDPLFLAAILLCSYPANAQESGDQVATEVPTKWERPITVVPDRLVYNDVEFPAHTITVHGTTANKLYSRWRSEMRAQSRDISGRKPTVVRGVMIEQVSSQPVDVLGKTEGDRKADQARLTVAFATPEGMPLPASPEHEAYLRDLAVRYNQAVVQEEIAARKKDLERAQRRTDKASSNEQRTRNRMQRALDRQEQAALKRERAQVGKAELEGQVIGLERKLAVKDTNRDQKKLLRARRQLAKQEAEVLKWMEREARFEAEANKHQGQLPDHDRVQRERTQAVQELEQEINALENVHDRIE